MTISSPSAETVRFIATILSVRQISVAELPSTIALLASTVQRLGAPVAEPATQPAPRVAKPKRRVPTVVARAAARAVARAVMERTAVPVAPEPVAAVKIAAVKIAAEASVKRGRGRPRRVAVEAPVVAEEPVVAVAQPKLLRRAQVSEAEPRMAEPMLAPPPAGGSVRGVVKWYDPKAGKGALRLTGISGDVAIDPAILSRDGIKRLYKDQEIEATVEDKGGRVRLTGLSLRSRNVEPAAAAMGDSDIPAILRRPRQVLVEVKRDGSRRSAARAEAEQLLGGTGPGKITRRLNP